MKNNNKEVALMFDVAPLSMERTSQKKNNRKHETGRVVNDKISVYLKEKSQKTNNLEALLKSKLPEQGEQIHIITVKNFDAFSFVQLILQHENIAELWAAVYRIGDKTAKALLQLKRQGKIDDINLVLNDGFRAMAPGVDRLLMMNTGEIRVIKCNNHSKITLMKTTSGRHYVVEGSGNWSINGRIEQYVFSQSLKLFEFHKKWMYSYVGAF